MTKSSYITLGLNILGICLLIYVISFGSTNQVTKLENGGELSERLHLGNILIVPVIVLAINVFYILALRKKTT